MDDKDRQGKSYTGTKGLSLAIVIGVAIGTAIGKLTGNMNTGLMLGLVLGVCGWVLLYNRRPAEKKEEQSGQTGGDPGDGQHPD